MSGDDPWVIPEATAQQAVERWLRHPAVRPAVEGQRWREGASLALGELTAAVGLVDQLGISWLILDAANQRVIYRDGSTWDTPSWASRVEAKRAAAKLLTVSALLASALAEEGVPISPESSSDRLVLAQLVSLEPCWDWSDPARMVAEQLNVGAAGDLKPVDPHANDRVMRALNQVSREVTRAAGSSPMRKQHVTMYDDTLRAILAEKRDVTVDEAISLVDARRGVTADRRHVERRLAKLRKSG